MRIPILSLCLLALCCLSFLTATAPNRCYSYSCGCCCTQDSRPCCNPGYVGQNRPNSGSALAYNDGFVLDPEEEAIETLGLTPVGGSTDCRISCTDTYNQLKGHIHSILGISGSVTCQLPATPTFFSHNWKTTLDTEDPRCFTLYDLGGVNAEDRVEYLKQIAQTCFSKESFSCPQLESTTVATEIIRSDTVSPTYYTYYEGLVRAGRNVIQDEYIGGSTGGGSYSAGGDSDGTSRAGAGEGAF